MTIGGSMFLLSTLGLYIYLISYAQNSYFVYEEAIKQSKIQVLMLNSDTQQTMAKGTNQILKEINEMQLDVVYSNMNYEKYAVWNYSEQLGKVYSNYLKQSEINSLDDFVTQVNILIFKVSVMIFCIVTVLGIFVYVYKKRIQLMSLVLSLVLFLLIAISLNLLGQFFMKWSSVIEFCEEIYDMEKTDLPPYHNRLNDVLNEYVTCLNKDEKQKLNSFILSLSIGQNTVFNIINNYIDTSMPENGNLFESIQTFLIHEKLLKQKIQNQTYDGNITAEIILNYLNIFSRQNEVYNKLRSLEMCEATFKWARVVVDKVCRKGLRYMFYVQIFFILILISTLVMAGTIFLTENVIKGLKKYEKKFVNTGMQRFDWSR